jgi:hypothetical protein
MTGYVTHDLGQASHLGMIERQFGLIRRRRTGDLSPGANDIPNGLDPSLHQGIAQPAGSFHHHAILASERVRAEGDSCRLCPHHSLYNDGQ